MISLRKLPMKVNLSAKEEFGIDAIALRVPTKDPVGSYAQAAGRGLAKRWFNRLVDNPIKEFDGVPNGLELVFQHTVRVKVDEEIRWHADLDVPRWAYFHNEVVDSFISEMNQLLGSEAVQCEVHGYPVVAWTFEL